MQNSHPLPTEPGNGCLLTSYVPCLCLPQAEHDALLFLPKSQHKNPPSNFIKIPSSASSQYSCQPLPKARQRTLAPGQREYTKESET